MSADWEWRLGATLSGRKGLGVGLGQRVFPSEWVVGLGIRYVAAARNSLNGATWGGVPLGSVVFVRLTEGF